MTYGTTYKVCKRLIEIKTFDKKSKDDLQAKMDVFLLSDSLNQTEYEELVDLLNAK